MLSEGRTPLLTAGVPGPMQQQPVAAVAVGVGVGVGVGVAACSDVGAWCFSVEIWLKMVNLWPFGSVRRPSGRRQTAAVARKGGWCRSAVVRELKCKGFGQDLI